MFVRAFLFVFCYEGIQVLRSGKKIEDFCKGRSEAVMPFLPMIMEKCSECSCMYVKEVRGESISAMKLQKGSSFLN